MKSAIAQIFDDKSKNLKWHNRNFFYATTLFVMALNICLYAFLGGSFQHSVENPNPDWGKFDLLNFVRVLANSYSHANWQHVLLNMLCFFFVSVYLERRMGSLRLLAVIFVMSFATATAVTANDLSYHWHGFSGVNYGLYAYTIVDYCFSFRKETRNKTNIILGAVVMVAIVVFMCFAGGTTGFSFKPYPVDLITNRGHYSSFIPGLLLGLTVNITKLSVISDRSTKQ
ncbi:MAG: rhomboid family intramembrane serine protease [Clostridia bacterium]|nr:rhomboid family intramembrane serine protease [Clostridia bacterium]